jgi:hypothetical protein
MSLPAVSDLVTAALPKTNAPWAYPASLIRRIPMALGPIIGGLLDRYGIRFAFSGAMFRIRSFSYNKYLFMKAKKTYCRKTGFYKPIKNMPKSLDTY